MICEICFNRFYCDNPYTSKCYKCKDLEKPICTIVKTARIDEIIKFINTDFKYYDNRGQANSDLIEMLENLKKEN